jgi:hypothetical protein
LDKEILKRAREFAAWSDWPYEFATAEEVASILRVPTAWVWAAAREGRIPYMRFDLAEVLEVIRRKGIDAAES